MLSARAAVNDLEIALIFYISSQTNKIYKTARIFFLAIQQF